MLTRKEAKTYGEEVMVDILKQAFILEQIFNDQSNFMLSAIVVDPYSFNHNFLVLVFHFVVRRKGVGPKGIAYYMIQMGARC